MLNPNFANIQQIFNDVLKISLHSYLHTGNPIFDAFISTLGVVVLGYFTKSACDKFSSFSYFEIYDIIKSCFYKKHTVIFQGRQNYAVSHYDREPLITSCFTDCFKALLFDILSNIKTNSVYEIKEFITSRKYDGLIESDTYMISQKQKFLYNKDLQIYAISDIYRENTDGRKNGYKIETETITIKLFSYVSTIDVIQKHVEMLKNNYLEMIEQKRHNKTFIYNLCKTTFENDKYECWNEMEFESTRTFRNMFFEGKDEIIKKISFFMNNKEWYYENGIPYSLGIGLHGPPGTGKTSFFKCLSNMTNRHIVIISLKLIKTKSQLDKFFFENEYTEHNKKHKIGFDKKIIIFEDIDCMGDIVLKRNRKKTIDSTENVNTVIRKIANQTDTDITEIKLQEDPITLDDILNLWDGLKETPGRILGISSNHYNKLDPALIRPGRIDISLHLNKVSHKILSEMFSHYYKKKIDPDQLKKIKEFFYSPAEIINYYVLHKDDPDAFLKLISHNSVKV